MFFLIVSIIIIVADYFIKSTAPVLVPSENVNSKYYPVKSTVFDKIPYPKIKSLSVANPTKVKVSKDTVTFPDFPPVVYLYKINPEQEHINDANQARALSKTLELTSGESKIINNVMYFETLNSDRVLSFDKVQRFWNYNIKLNSFPTFKVNDLTKIKSNSISFLGSMQLNSSNSFEVSVINAYLTYADNKGGFTTVLNNNYANSARILLNKKIELIKPISTQLPVLYAQTLRPDFLEGIANMTVINSMEKISSDMISFSYKAHDYDSTIGVYPILTPAEAFEKIQNDGGFLYSLTEKNGNQLEKIASPSIKEFKLNINSTKLIYIESQNLSDQEKWTNYLQPFYQFFGQAKSLANKDFDFSFIVPALQDAYYNGL